MRSPLVIAHRGASGYRPEHTLAAYRLAIAMGADSIEPDLVCTRDGVLVARHENEIGATTDVADHPELAERRTSRTVNGRQVTGWFTEDLTLAELRTLRAKERLPGLRPTNARFDGRFHVPTLDEILVLAQRASLRTGRRIGVVPEIKNAAYYASIGLPVAERVVAALRRHGLDRPEAPVLVESFEPGVLRELATMTRVPLAQLVDDEREAPYDLVAAGDTTTYRDLVTPDGLAEIATYAQWVAPAKDLVLPRDADGAIGAPSAVVEDARAAGLKVVVWTLRAENRFLPSNLRLGEDPAATGDLAGEVAAFVEAGVDAVFSDHPDVVVRAGLERAPRTVGRTLRAG
ncbi:glycerophosphodiester phosphodiesterase [Nocardioides sp. GY 10113]|uniref:glycerophosphodiester phosphodiesterase n=1 Tax=Nocardioides sp. GY 10113 TaxID=2569761 RepID=UPI0010A8160F|nr:glycerophosphodiester phosphodiesterase [Nocardioides sp. GY 10113]TIC87509.1 glycerophosphodiester phosphodiesterase [Nocardioides sp. GY 10113]